MKAILASLAALLCSLNARNFWLLMFFALPLSSSFAQTHSGYQVIDGTRVYTEIFESQGYAKFSNSCGSQTISQRELQAGAKPYNIIPCPRSRSSPPSNDSRVRCGEGYCQAGTICTQEKRCLSKSSHRVCSDGKTYCDSGSICIAGGKCLPTSSARYCGDGKYCSEGTFCTNDNKCVSMESGRYCGDGKYCGPGTFCADENKCYSIDSSRYCGDGRFCAAGNICDRSMSAGSNRCSPSTAKFDGGKKESKFVALVATNTGRFFGVGIADSQSEAMSEAKDVCEAFKLNTATTSEEREERCGFNVWVENGCVALARSHDMYHGPSEKFAAGMSTDLVVANASSEAHGLCVSKGGQSCYIVPESVKCSRADMEQ